MEELFAKYNINIPRVKGAEYCGMVTSLVKKFDLLGLVDESKMNKICRDLGFVNKSLNKAYRIIFKKGYPTDKIVKKLTEFKDPNNEQYINKKDALELINKFKTLHHKLRGGDGESDMGKQLHTNKTQSKPSMKNLLSAPQKKVIGDTFDMMEILLVCLSLLPVAGWTFDFPLVIYSLVNKKYTLIMITVLNWYIWAFCLIFGMNINLGPTLKASYLGNQENVVKKALLYPEKEPSKVLQPYTDARVKRMPDGKNYLIDNNGNVYSAEVASPETVGLITVDNRFVKRNDPEYENALLNKKKALKKDKLRFYSSLRRMMFLKWLIPSLLVYRQMNKALVQSRRIDPFVTSRILSTIHAIATFSLCSGYLFNLLSVESLEAGILMVSPAYFIMDLMHMTVYYKRYKGLQYWSYFLHHIITIYATSLITSHPYYFSRAFLAELSTPFINLSWYLQRKNNIKRLYLANGLVTLCLFASIRVYNYTNLLSETIYTEPITYNILIGCLWMMNCGWTYKLGSIFYNDFKKYLKKD